MKSDAVNSGNKLVHPSAWRRLVRDINATCRSGAASISIGAPAGSGRSLVLDQIEHVASSNYEHVLRVDGRVFGVAERRIRTWIIEQKIDAGVDTFQTLRELMAKGNYLLILVDRASQGVLDQLATPDLGGAVVATTTPSGPRLAEHHDLDPFPNKRGWEEVQRRSESGLVVAGTALGPKVSAIGAISHLDESSLRLLISTTKLAGTGAEAVELGHVLRHVVPDLSDQERAVLRAYTLLGPGDTVIASVGSVHAGRRHIVGSNDIPSILDSLSIRGLVSRAQDIVSIDAGLIEAVHNPGLISASQRRSALHMITQLMLNDGEFTTDQIDVGLRLLHWCEEVGFCPPQVTKLREAITERLVDDGLLVSAIHELVVAVAGDEQRGELEDAAHHRVDIGLIARRLGRFDDALSAFESALADFGVTSGSQRNEAVTLSNIGMIHQQLGNHGDAVDTLDHARSVLARSSGDTVLDDVTISIPLTVSLLKLGRTARVQAELRDIEAGLRACDAPDEHLAALQDDFNRIRQVINNGR